MKTDYATKEEVHLACFIVYFFIPYPEKNLDAIYKSKLTHTTRSPRKHFSLLLWRQKPNQEALENSKNIFTRIIIETDKIITVLLEN